MWVVLSDVLIHELYPHRQLGCASPWHHGGSQAADRCWKVCLVHWKPIIILFYRFGSLPNPVTSFLPVTPSSPLRCSLFLLNSRKQELVAVVFDSNLPKDQVCTSASVCCRGSSYITVIFSLSFLHLPPFPSSQEVLRIKVGQGIAGYVAKTGIRIICLIGFLNYMYMHVLYLPPSLLSPLHPPLSLSLSLSLSPTPCGRIGGQYPWCLQASKVF